MTMDANERARRSAEAMWSNDSASKWFGFVLVDVSEGRSEFKLRVEQHHCNGHGICHGGVTFALADTAFAFACNSRNQSTVAQANLINFIAPAQVGDELTATASEVSLSGRSGIYDVSVTNQDNKIIGQFRGMSRAIRGQLFDEDT